MIRMHEALENASRNKDGVKGSPEVLPAVRRVMAEAEKPWHLEMEMLTLFQAIHALLPKCPRKIIQFIGSLEGEGTSTIAREFARVSAFEVGQSVLLLDADRTQPTQHHYFALAEGNGWLEAIKNCRGIDGALYKIEDSKLFVSPSSNSTTFSPDIFNSASSDGFWKILKDRFDLIIVDSAPLTRSPDGLAIAPKADGVVLVIEAERTRGAVAENVKERISQVGGNILGLVFNKRRFYIPESIYKRLR
jgi:protein-tyrosine kinase